MQSSVKSGASRDEFGRHQGPVTIDPNPANAESGIFNTRFFQPFSPKESRRQKGPR
jgi:hypothetical protein